MLLIFNNGQHIDNTGQTAALKNAMMAEGWWRATRQAVIAPNTPDEELTFVWVEDSSRDADIVYQTGGRVSLVDGELVHGEVPAPPPPSVEQLKAELGRLLNIRAGQIEMNEDTAEVQAKIDAMKTEIQAARQ